MRIVVEIVGSKSGTTASVKVRMRDGSMHETYTTTVRDRAFGPYDLDDIWAAACEELFVQQVLL